MSAQKSEWATIRRINRRLAKDGLKLRKLRGDRWISNLGRFYIVDCLTNAAIVSDVDLDSLDTELEPSEVVA